MAAAVAKAVKEEKNVEEAKAAATSANKATSLLKADKSAGAVARAVGVLSGFVPAVRLRAGNNAAIVEPDSIWAMLLTDTLFRLNWASYYADLEIDSGAVKLAIISLWLSNTP